MLYMKFLWVDALIFFFAFFLKGPLIDWNVAKKPQLFQQNYF